MSNSEDGQRLLQKIEQEMLAQQQQQQQRRQQQQQGHEQTEGKADQHQQEQQRWQLEQLQTLLTSPEHVQTQHQEAMETAALVEIQQRLHQQSEAMEVPSHYSEDGRNGVAVTAAAIPPPDSHQLDVISMIEEISPASSDHEDEPALKLRSGVLQKVGRVASPVVDEEQKRQQKLELTQWRKKAAVEVNSHANQVLETPQSFDVLQSSAMPSVAPTVHPSSVRDPPPALSDVQPTKDQGRHNKDHLLSILNQTLVTFCHENLYFVDFAHISGRFSFNLDNRETMHLVVSQMTTPQAFIDLPPKNRSATQTESNAPKVEAFVPRKRGRRKKSQKPPPSPDPVLMETSTAPTSTKSGSGRRAAARAKQKLSIISCDMATEDAEPAPPSDPVPKPDGHSDDEDYVPDQGPDDDVKQVKVQNVSMDVIDEAGDANGSVVKTEISDKKHFEIQILETLDAGPSKAEPDEPCETTNGLQQAKVDPEYSEETEATQFSCEKCQKKFATEAALQDHVNRHKIFHCSDDNCKNLEFFTRGQLRMHFRSVHSKSQKHLQRCKKCHQEFLTRVVLKQHMEAEHSHICSVCGETFMSKVALKKHKDASHLELSCTICGHNLLNKAALNRHMRRHKERAGGKIKCDQCDKQFTALTSLNLHKRAAHEGVKPYKCDLCEMSFNFKNSLKLHVLKHSGQRPYECDVCNKSYLTANHLKNHVQAVHSSHKAYICPICDKRFPYDNSLKLHMKLHSGERPFLCEVCSKTFVTKNALKVHENTHIESKEFKCDLCEKHYKTESLLKNHRRRHTEDGSRYMCDICGNTYMYKSNLEAHYEVHGDTKKHQCSICQKTFKTYPTLYSHYLVHSTKNPFECGQCGKAFKTKERLKAHEVRHSGAKPYTCESCGSSFPDKGGLSKHKRTVHADTPRFACPTCGKHCNRMDNLRVHMKVHGDPALLKLSQKELSVNDPTGKPKLSDTFPRRPPVPAPLNNDQEHTPQTDILATASQDMSQDISQSIHTLEAAQGLESLRVPIAVPRTESSTQETSAGQTLPRLVTNTGELQVSQIPATAFMGIPGWSGNEGALQYQNVLLTQGYQTSGVIQPQTSATDITHGTYNHAARQSHQGQGQSQY